MEDPRIISALFIFLKMAYYNVLINTLTIPEWLNEAATRAGVNYSQVLQEALMRKLNISR
jgi:antitoxin HicB